MRPSSLFSPSNLSYILTNSDSGGQLRSSQPDPIEVVQSINYHFVMFLCCLPGLGAQNWMFSCLVRRFKDFYVRHRNEEQKHLAIDCSFFLDANLRQNHDA